MRISFARLSHAVMFLTICACQSNKEVVNVSQQLDEIKISRGDIALCGTNQFGNVNFGLSCEEKVRNDFNTATALLHSFEYVEAEKVFAKVIEADPKCIMAYWGIAMSNYHPLWAPPTKEELEKGQKTIELVRKLDIESPRELGYINAIATIFHDWETVDLKTRLDNFVKAAEVVYKNYPEDKEAALFYALALRSSADPADKTFAKQIRAGEILNGIFPQEPNHPGVAHYLIHNYDYPELAGQGLDAARKYAAIAANSAHAQHMPSHIFTRLGLWDESIQSNTNSMAAAKCYAENLGAKGHWDQELHGLDYVVYAYLQQGRFSEAKLKVDYLASIDSVFPLTFVNAYTFAATPARYALERKDWKQAASLELRPLNFPWEKFRWQEGIQLFARIVGAVNLNQIQSAKGDLVKLSEVEKFLLANKKDYEANQTRIQITAAEGLINFAEGNKSEGIEIMKRATEMEAATEKHPVTPGEVLPTLEILGDLYMKAGQFEEAYDAYTSNLKLRPGRFNSIFGAAKSAMKSGREEDAKKYFKQFIELTASGDNNLPERQEALVFLNTRRTS